MVERDLAQQVQSYDQVGEVTIVLPFAEGGGIKGEGTFVVTFLNAFIEKPTFTFGSELAVNHSPLAGAFPTMSATVSRWQTRKAGYSTLYLGATLVYVASGAANSHIICHYSFRGSAMSPLSTPINDTGTA